MEFTTVAFMLCVVVFLFNMFGMINCKNLLPKVLQFVMFPSMVGVFLAFISMACVLNGCFVFVTFWMSLVACVVGVGPLVLFVFFGLLQNFQLYLVRKRKRKWK